MSLNLAADTMQTQTIMATFTPDPTIARFAVGPEAIASGDFEKAINAIPRDAGQVPPASWFEVTDQDLGVVECGPMMMPRRGHYQWDVDAMSKALNARPLPVPMHAHAWLPFERGIYARALVAFFSALEAAGAVLKHEPKKETNRSHFYSWINAIFSTPDVELEMVVGTRFDQADDLLADAKGRIGSHFQLCEDLGSNGEVTIVANLVDGAMRNSVKGHSVLEQGMRKLLMPWLSGVGGVTLRPRDDARDSAIYYRNKIIADISGAAVPRQIDAIKLDNNGKYLGQF